MATRNLFESATARGRVLRQGDIVCIVFDGAGAVVVSSQDFLLARKWAQAKPASGNALTDRSRLLEQVGTLVSRLGSQYPTRGSAKQIQTLLSRMQQAGYDLNDWAIPPELQRTATPAPDLVRKTPGDGASKPEQAPPEPPAARKPRWGEGDS